jgi:iron complex outermembrane recepter protein
MRKLVSYFLFIWLCCFFLPNNLFAQSEGVIKGIIQDSETGQPIVGATIIIDGSTNGSISNQVGEFELKTAQGTYKIIINMLGYKDLAIENVQVTGGTITKLATITLKEEGMGVEEVEVFANIIDGNRQAPTPIATISAQEIEEKMGAQEFPEMLKSTPGVFVNTGGGSWGDSQIRIRGFTSENTAVLFNGIPVNDMESGRVFWANWSGLSDVTRNQQVQRGLGVSKLAVSSVGGTINIISNPADQRKGARMESTVSDRSLKYRTTWKYSTGLMKGDWAVTGVLSRRWGEGFREGTGGDVYSYYLAAYKRINTKHQLIFTGYGVYQYTGRGGAATEENYAAAGRTTYNPYWGTFQGQELNARENRSHKPMFILNHYWDVSKKVTISNAIYYSWADAGGAAMDRVSGTTNTNNELTIIPNPIPGGTLTQTFQLNFDYMASQNQGNLVTIRNANGSGLPFTGYRSRYALKESVNNHQWVGALSTVNIEASKNLSMTFGVDARWYRGFHYQRVKNLLGGDFWLDVDRNVQDDVGRDMNNNLLTPNRVALQGDKVGYDYNGTVRWLGTFGQVEYTPIRNLDIFATLTFVYNDFQRNGKMLNEKYFSTSLGNSELQSFNNYTFKAGANYKITGRHNVFFNAGTFTRAPFFQNAFSDNRTTNIIRGSLTSERVTSFEFGYGYRSPKFVGNFNLYSTSWENRSYTQGFLGDLAFLNNPNVPTGTQFINYQLYGVNALHRGVEIDFATQIPHLPELSLSGMLSVGDWRYLGNPKADILADPVGVPYATDVTINADRLRVGGQAQTTAALGLRYRNQKGLFVGMSSNFYDNMYADYNPETRTTPDAYFNQVRRLPNAFTFDMFAGKTFRLDKRVRCQVKGSLNNITDYRFMIDANERTPSNLSPFVQYYFGRTYSISVVMEIN